MPDTISLPLERALQVGAEIVEVLGPLSKKIAIAGSVRRRRPVVNDIDIIMLVNIDQFGAAQRITGLCKRFAIDKSLDKDGEQIKRWFMRTPECTVQIDLFIALDPEEWATYELIWTGPKGSNIRICQTALDLGYRMRAGGQGLFSADGKTRIAYESEAAIFAALGLKYKEPWERD